MPISDRFVHYLKIDSDRLDEELIRFPNRFWEVTAACREVSLTIDRLKFVQLQHAARAGEDARAVHTKATETYIKQLVSLDPEYTKITNRLDELEYEYRSLKDLVDAMEMKARSLTKLVDLYTTDYYAPNSAPSTSYRRKVERRPLRESP